MWQVFDSWSICYNRVKSCKNDDLHLPQGKEVSKAVFHEHILLIKEGKTVENNASNRILAKKNCQG